MTWHVYYLGIYIAQFVHADHARDFCIYNRNCTTALREYIAEKDLFTERFTTTEIGFLLHNKTGEWL